MIFTISPVRAISGPALAFVRCRVVSMSVRHSSLASGQRRAVWLGVSIVITAVGSLAGCACLVSKTGEDPQSIDDPSLAMKPAVDGSLKDQGTPQEPATKEATFRPADVNPALLKKPNPPSCEIKGAAKPADSEVAGATADPNLVEIARLQLERDCFKDAERNVRQRLDRLQKEVTPNS